MLCLQVGLLAHILFGTLCALWTYMSISFTKLGKFSFIVFSSRFPISCSCSSPSGTPMMQMLEHLKLSQKLLIWALIFWIFSSFSDWFFASLCSKPLILYLFQLVYPSFLTGSFLCSKELRSSLSYLSNLITNVLNSASDRLLTSILFSSFSGVLSLGSGFFVS